MRAKLRTLALAVSLLLVGQLFAQEVTVTGTVISGENRDGLPGANIVVKGTDRGTTTDFDGNFTFDVSPGEVLVFKFIGFQEKEISVGDNRMLKVTLTPEAISGEEVTVVGYGTQKRKDVTSSIATLAEHAFNKGVITDPQLLLQSRIPGVTVSSSGGDLGAAPLIRIRGGTSVTAGNEPMIVIDGVPVSNESSTPSFDPEGIGGGTGTDNPAGGLRENALANINPSDIASIDVLKDASAAAIYGARGGNGVILITTKSGQVGGSSLTYETYTSTSSQSKTYDLLNAQQYRAFAQQVGAATESMLDANTDWQDAINRTGLSHNHNISFSSGNEITQYLVSASYLDEEGIILGSDRQRISGRINVSHQALENKLRLGLRVNPSFTKRNNTPYRQTGGFRGGLFTNVLKYNPTLPVKQGDGAFYHFPNPDIRNPVAMAELIEDKSETMRIFMNATAEYDFFPGLTGKINLGLDRSDGTRGQYQPRSLPYAASFGGRADLAEQSRQNVLFETTFNYETNVSDNQNLDLTGAYTFQEFDYSIFGAAAQDFVTDAFSYNNLEGGADFSDRPYSFADDNRLISLLGRAIYSIDDKYLFNAAIRYEGSSRFGSGKKWGTFPSASIGWRLSQESFMQNMSALSDLKLRLSYGVTGNQDIGNFRSLLILGTGANGVFGDQVLTGVSPTQLPNPDLKWEETTQLNLGIDFGFNDNRISGSIDLYNKTTTDLLLEFAVPQPAVVETRIDNAGKVENKGIELSLNTINISSGELFWRTSFNFAKNNNEVVNLGERQFISAGRVSGAGLSGVDAQIYLPGQPVGTFFGPRFMGYDDDGEEILSTDPDVLATLTDKGPLGDGRFILGDAQPDYTFGISSTTTYKKWDLRFSIQGVQGFDLLNNTRLEYQRPSNVFNGINLFADALKDVEAGLDPNATVAYTDRFIEDASFVRLQNVTLGYTFSSDFVQSMRLRDMRIYLSADNLFLLTDYKGLDPEVNTFAEGDAPSLGIDYTNYPRARTFTIGLSLGVR
jgi:iron complex outermembrane receptor protein